MKLYALYYSGSEEIVGIYDNMTMINELMDKVHNDPNYNHLYVMEYTLNETNESYIDAMLDDED